MYRLKACGLWCGSALPLVKRVYFEMCFNLNEIRMVIIIMLNGVEGRGHPLLFYLKRLFQIL
jgi:hypothetical protein